MIERVAVVIPAADEQDRIAACLHAISHAAATLRNRRARHERAVTVDVIVALDACIDDTAAVVGRFPDVATISLDARQVGAARRAGTHLALQRAAQVGVTPEQVWLANTDADSIVPPDWVAYTVSRADAGDEVLLGTVRPDHELDDRRTRAWHSTHTLGDGHPHIHGANFGIRADVLSRLGGWRALATGEDVDLVTRAQDARARIHRGAAAPVLTSARAIGRAPAGFSSYLRHL